MHLTCATAPLREAVQDASHHLAGAPRFHPMARHVLLVAEEDTLRVVSTDAHGMLTTTLPATTTATGACAVPADLLAAVLAAAPTDELALAMTDVGPGRRDLRVRAGSLEATLYGLPPEDYPRAPDPAAELPVGTVPLEAWTSALRAVRYAASADQTRRALSGIYLDPRPEGLVLVAADGYRLAYYQVPVSPPLPEPVLLSARMLARCPWPAAAATLSIRVGERHCWLEAGTTCAVLTRLAEPYPDYRKLIPTVAPRARVRFDRHELLGVLRAALPFARGDEGAVQLVPADGQLQIRAASAVLGEQVATVAARTEGEPFSCLLNGHYLVDAVSALPGDTGVLDLHQPTTALYLHPEDPTTGHLIMPMNRAAPRADAAAATTTEDADDAR